MILYTILPKKFFPDFFFGNFEMQFSCQILGKKVQSILVKVCGNCGYTVTIDTENSF